MKDTYEEDDGPENPRMGQEGIKVRKLHNFRAVEKAFKLKSQFLKTILFGIYVPFSPKRFEILT